MTSVHSSSADLLLDDLAGCGLARDAAAELVDYVRSEPFGGIAIHGAILGGSRSFGLFNAYSDIDVVMLVEEKPAKPTGDQATIAGQVVHVEGVTRAEVDVLMARFRREHLPLVNLSPVAHQVITAARRFTELSSGVVLNGADAIAELRRTLPSDHVPRLIAESYQAYQGGMHRDAAGALRSGDWATAVEATLIALDHAVQAAVAVSGDLYVPRKFLARRAQRLSESLFDRYQAERSALTAAAAAGAAAAVPAVERALRAATDISAGAIIGWVAAPPVETPRGPLRTAHYCLVRFDEGLLLMGSDNRPVTLAVAETWLAHDGRGQDEIADALAQRWDRPVAKVAPFVAAVARELAQAGLLDADGG